MTGHRTAWPPLAAGTGLLWVVWGQVFDLLVQSGKASARTDPRGLHLDALA